MLDLVPQGWFSRRFEVHRDGVPVAQLRLGWLREGGALTIAGDDYVLAREGLASGAYSLSHHGQEVVRAIKPSAFRERLEIDYEGSTYELAKVKWWGNTFELRREGDPVGEVRPHHAFTRRSTLSMPEEFPLPVAVFIAALVMVLRNRQAAAAGG